LPGWSDAFEESEDLVSLSSGCVTSESVTQDLLTAQKKGTDALATFVEDRLLSNSKVFYGTLSKLKLGTFSDVQKKSSLSKEGKTVILRAERNLFA